MGNELISIIVPVYNVSKYLDRCMKSLLNQTYKNIEIIMVDDGSTDDCGTKCDAYAKEDSRVRVIHKKNAGLGMARNSALDISNGKYVTFIDSDDYTNQKMIERMYKKLSSQKADTCFCRYNNVLSNGEEVLAAETYSKNEYRDDEIKSLLLGMIGSLPDKKGDVEIGMSVWKGLYSLEIINKNNIHFPSEREYISEDIIFHIDYLQKARYVVIENSANYYYCDNGGSLTKSYKFNRFAMEKILFNKEKEELSKLFKENEFKQRLYKSFLGRVRRCISQEVNDNPNRKSVRNNVRNICSDNLVQYVIKDYDDHGLSLLKKVVNRLIIRKRVFALYITFKVRK